MVQSSENSLARSPQDGGSPAVGSGKDRQRGQQFRVDREVVPSIGVDPDAAPASGLSRVTAEPLTSVVDNHVDVTPKVVVQSGATFLSGEPVLVAKAAGVTVVEDAGTSHEPSAGPATALAPRSRLRDRGGDRDGWVVFVDGDGTSAPLPEPPARDVPQLLPKGRERTLEVSRVADEVREEAQRRMADADSLEDFVLWQRAAITDGQSDRVGWVWDFRRPTEDDLIEGNETAENKAEIAKKVAIMEALKEKIDALPPQDGMVRVAIKRIDTGDDDFLPPTYQVLGTFPEGIFVKDELQRFLRGKEIDNAKQAAREEGKAATAFFEPTQPCSMITCSALQEVFGEEAFYILYDERAETGEGVDTVTAAIHGNSAAESEYKLYLLTGLAGGFGNEFFRVRISDYRKWEIEYANAQGSGTPGEPAQANTQAAEPVSGELSPSKPAQLADSGEGRGSDDGGKPTLIGEPGDGDKDLTADETGREGVAPRPRRRPMFTLEVAKIEIPPVLDSEIPRKVTDAIIKEEFSTAPRLESAILEEFIVEQIQQGVVSSDAVADAFVQEGYAARMEEYLQKLKDKSAELDWDSIFSPDDYADVKSKLSAEMEAMGMTAEQIASVNQMGIKFTEGGGVSSLDGESIYVSKLQILRRAMNYQEVFGTDIPLEEIVKIMMKATAGHELGHQIDHVTPGYAVNNISADPEWFLEGKTIERKDERFSEYWGRLVVADDEVQSMIIQRDWALLVAKKNQVWDEIRTQNGTHESKAEIYKILNTIMDRLRAENSPLLPIVESKMLGFGSNALENYAAFYPRDVVAGAVASEGKVQARTEIPRATKKIRIETTKDVTKE